jgi:carbon storage regulator
MLVLTRRIGEEIVIADHIRLSVLSINRTSVRFGIAAPPEVRVDRQEIHTRRLLARNGSGSKDHAPQKQEE